MNEYTVTWTVEVDGDTPEDAARRARAMQLDPDSSATVFEVTAEIGDGNPQTVPVDLSALDGQTQAKGKCTHCGGDAPLAPDGLTMYHGDRNTMQGDCLGSRELPAPA